MDRREALKLSTYILGYSLTAGTTAALLGGCKAKSGLDWYPQSLSSDEAVLLEEVCEIYLPATDTPGAKDALCHRYIDEVITHFYDETQVNDFKNRLKVFNDTAKAKYSKAFVALNENESSHVMNLVASDARKHRESKATGQHIFDELKGMTISGYFTSEVGATGGLANFMPMPGPYEGCIDFPADGKVYVHQW